jgi:hypothetical protein
VEFCHCSFPLSAIFYRCEECWYVRVWNMTN